MANNNEKWRVILCSGTTSYVNDAGNVNQTQKIEDAASKKQDLAAQI